MVVQRTEAAAEREVRTVIEVLRPEDQHEVLEPGAADRIERRVVERLAQVHAPDLRAEPRGEPYHFHLHAASTSCGAPVSRRARRSP